MTILSYNGSLREAPANFIDEISSIKNRFADTRCSSNHRMLSAGVGGYLFQYATRITAVVIFRVTKTRIVSPRDAIWLQEVVQRKQTSHSQLDVRMVGVGSASGGAIESLISRSTSAWCYCISY